MSGINEDNFSDSEDESDDHEEFDVDDDFSKITSDEENEFGEINQDGQIFTTAYLKMTGNTDDINISFDGVKIKENIKENINTEIKTIKTIIKEDILKTQEKEKEEEEGEDIIIEFEEEYMPE